MAFELAQVIAQLVQAIAPLREAEGSQDGLMDLLGRPASDLRAAVQEDFHQPDDARLVDLDAGIAHRADGNRQGNALQQRKVPVNVEPLGLGRGEAAGNGLELLPDRIEILQALLETEVPERLTQNKPQKKWVSLALPHDSLRWFRITEGDTNGLDQNHPPTVWS